MIPETSITFAGSFLDRADALRTDIPQLDHHMVDPTSKTLPFWQGKPLFDLTPAGPRLAWLPVTDDLITGAEIAPALLGLDKDGVAHFAADVSYRAAR